MKQKNKKNKENGVKNNELKNNELKKNELKNNEIIFDEIICYQCKGKIINKPWIILNCENNMIYGCSYKCSKDLGQFMGGSYWEYIVNKDDFLKDPIPYTFDNNNKLKKGDICFNSYEINEIRDEIIYEEIMNDKYEKFLDENYSDEEEIEEE